MRILMASLTFLLIGPTVGYLIGMGFYVSDNVIGDMDGARGFVMTAIGMMVFWPVAYFVGGLPALLTGALAGWLYDRVGRLFYYVAVGVAGAGTSLGVIGGQFSAEPELPWGLGLLGCVASLICAWLFRRLVDKWWTQLVPGAVEHADRR